MSWATAFLITQLVEVPIYAYWFRKWSWPRRLGAGFTASALTHPWLWFVFPGWFMKVLGYWGYVALGEAAVVLAEAGLFVLAGSAPRGAFQVATLANVASMLVGFACWAAVK